MNLGKDNPIGRFKWHGLAIYVALIGVVLLVIFTDVFDAEKGVAIPQIIFMLAAIIIVIALVLILTAVFRTADAIDDGNAKLDNLADELAKTREILAQVNQGSRLTETTKSIAFRDAEMRTLQDAVFDKLQQKDFDAAGEIIDEIAHRTGNKRLAEQLRVQATKYRDASDVERMNQVIAHIEKLLEEHQWAKASAHIEQLIKASSNSEKALAMRQRLNEKKDERKKVLLNAWDDAVKRQATDRSLEILRELDQYLTANEGLALQEAARDVFRTKLHNLGVQFSLAVSGGQWTKALETGLDITREFPNSRMAEEIREKLEILKRKVEQKGV